MSKTQDIINERKKRQEFTSNVTSTVFSEIEKHLKGCQGGINITISTGKWGRDRFFTISKRRDKIVIRVFNSGDVDIIVTEMAYENFRISLLKYESEIDIDDAVAKLRKGIKLFIDVLFDKDMHILMDFMADTCLGAKWEECMDSYSNFLLEGVCE